MKKVGVIRPKFVDGMLLTAEDLRLEQCYLDRRLIQFGQRFGWGVVEGMQVDDHSLGRPRPTLEVRPGCALDAQGREIVLGEDQERKIEIDADQQIEIAAKGGFVCVQYCAPMRLPAAIAAKLAPPKAAAQIVRTIERAKLGILYPEKLEQGIRDGWVPLAHIDLPAGKTIAIEPRLGLTSIKETSWRHNGPSLPREWSVTFSAPIAKPPPQAIEIRVRDEAGTDVRPDVTNLKLDDAGTKLSFNVARIVKGVVHIRIACDFIIDWKGQAVSGAHLGGHLPSGNGIAGGVFESWIVAKGIRS